ncbi:MAG: hypothetical protein ACI8TX_002627 [Hyphomicrobiaceae bacterium]|jgi:hypothetical protein
MAGRSPAEFYLVLREGHRDDHRDDHRDGLLDGGMPPWGDALGETALWDQIALAWTRRMPSPPPEMARCRGCHTPDPDLMSASDLVSPASLIFRSDDELAAAVSALTTLTTHPGHDDLARTALLARWLAYETPRSD